MSKIKIRNETGYGTDTKVFYVDDNGNETKISDVIKSIDLTITAGDMIHGTMCISKMDLAITELTGSINVIDD